MLDFETNLIYGVGQLAYAVAKIDGKIQNEEKDRLHKFVVKELSPYCGQTDVAPIIFEILNKDKQDFDTSYKFAMSAVKLSSHLLNKEVNHAILNIMVKVAATFPPVTFSEAVVIEKIRQDLDELIQKK